MGVFVRFKLFRYPDYFGADAMEYWRDYWADYIDFLSQTVEFFARRTGYPRFHAKDCSVWDEAPLEALGGSKMVEGKYPDLLNELDVGSQSRLLNSIVRVTGVWDFEESEFEGYCEAHLNRNWRGVYGDFEIDGYPDYGDNSDLTDALWRHNGRKEVIRGYLDLSRSFGGRVSRVRYVFFTPSPSLDKRLDLVRAIYAPTADVLLSAAVRSLRNAQPWADKRARPYNIGFLLSVIRADKYASGRLESLLTKHEIEKTAGSVMYIGKHEDSFQKVYEELCDEVLVPAFRALPAKKDIRSQVRAAIRHQKSLFEIK
ncbi:MAG: hypothetical protein ACE5KV_06185 [Thermoplasmata archaeon]